MHKINIVEGLEQENATKICNWTNEKGIDFLEQWAGTNLLFPLTIEELYKHENIYSIFLEDEFIGIIQKIRIEDNNVHIGRFVINPKYVGKGIGGEALSKFIRMLFMDLKVNSISLAVFDYNIGAKKLYEKYGFEVYEVIESPQKKYMMKKMRS